MGISPLFNLKKVLFMPYLSSLLSQEFEIRCVHLVEGLNVTHRWSGLFSLSSFSHSPKKVSFLVRFSHFAHFLNLFLAQLTSKLS